MSNDSKLTPGADLVARVLCLIVATALGLASMVVLNHDATLGFWLLALAFAAFVVFALFGPRRVRAAIIATLPGF